MCMAIRDTILERHICTSEWAVSNLLPEYRPYLRIAITLHVAAPGPLE
jgi:hypothetical protein